MSYGHKPASIFFLVLGALFLSALPCCRAFAAEAKTDTAGMQALTAPLSPEERKIIDALSVPVSQKPIPDEKNAAVIYRRVFAVMEADPEFSRDKASARADVANGTRSALKSGFEEPMPPNGQGKSKGLEILYGVKGLDCNFGVDWREGWNAELPHLGKMREIARMLVFQARFDVENSRPDRALEHIGLIFEMSRQLSDEPVLMSNEVSLALRWIGRQALVRLALEKRDDRVFVTKAAALIENAPALNMTPAEVIRSDVRVLMTTFLSIVQDPEAKVYDFTDELMYCIKSIEWFAAPDEESRPEPKKERRGNAARYGVEKVAGLPPGSFDDTTFRVIAERMIIFRWRQSERIAVAYSEGTRAVARTLEKIEKESEDDWPDMPEAFLTRLFGETERGVPAQFAKSDVADAAVLAVLDALARGDSRVAVVKDPFGKPYIATLFEKTAYFETQSEWGEPHNLDLSLGAMMSYDEYRKSLTKAAPELESTGK